MNNKDKNWKPLTELWDTYDTKIREAILEGDLEDPAKAEAILWPTSLYIGDSEKTDIDEFVRDRTYEILEQIEALRGVHPKLLGSYIFRSLISGMVWERQRIG